MPEYQIEVYSIRDDNAKVLYVGRRTLNEPRSFGQSKKVLMNLQRDLQDDNLQFVSEGIFGTALLAAACVRKLSQLKALDDELAAEEEQEEPSKCKLRKRAVKFGKYPGNKPSHFVKFVWNEKAGTFFTEPCELFTPP